MDTLLLDTQIWDLCLDSSGNIARATDPYSVAQDVASACRCFTGECWYDTARGIPYFQQVLGKFPPLPLVKNLIAKAAATVPGCHDPVVFFISFDRRALVGQVQFTDDNAMPQVATLVETQGPFILGQSILGGPNVI